MEARIGDGSVLSIEDVRQILTEAEQTCSASEDHIGFTLVVEAHLDNGKKSGYDVQMEHLKVLHQVLQTSEVMKRDAAWDLVKPVLTFAFEAKQPAGSRSAIDQNLESIKEKKLHDEALSLVNFLVDEGNPREVFISLIEVLASLSFREPEEDLDDLDINEGECEDDEALDNETQNFTSDKRISAKIDEANFLMLMLSKLLQRLKTKKLSRFLTSCLVPLLSLVVKGSSALSCSDLCILIDHVEAFLTKIWTIMSITRSELIKTDPEEFAIQLKLLQAFQTHVVERFFLSQSNETQSTYGRWAKRFDDVVRPEKVVPKRPNGDNVQNSHTETENVSGKDAKSAVIRTRVQRMMDFIWNLECQPAELLKACLVDDTASIADPSIHEDEDEPNNSAEIPLAPVGSLLILLEQQFQEKNLALQAPFSNFKIFPHHQQLVIKFLLQDNADHCTIDAILCIGHRILAQYSHELEALGRFSGDDDRFFLYLQKFDYIATTCEDADLRYLAHLHVASVLGLHPNDEFRLNYIKDTLEYCPFESLKAATVTKLKDFILSDLKKSQSTEKPKELLFLSPKLFEELLDVLFPTYSAVLSGQELEISFGKFQEIYGTVTTTANLGYITYANPILKKKLGLESLEYANHIKNKWALPVMKTIMDYQKAIEDGKFTFVLDSEVPEIKSQLDMTMYLLVRLVDLVNGII